MAQKTTCSIVFGQDAIAIKDDASIAVINGGLKSIGDVDALKKGTVPSAPYATFESNYWLLDGNFKIAPSVNPRGGWISTDISGASGNFDFGTPKPELQIDFDDVHSTDGLYLTFSDSGDYADSIRVVFYNSSLVTIRDDTYTPNGETFFTNQPIANFKRILIAINSTNRASRYARLQAIDFDTLTRFTGTEIKFARVVEQINPLALELPFNTIELDLFSSDGDFSIVDPSGFFENLQYKEPLDVYEDVNGDTLYIGRFYLDEWESINANNAHFQASDAINLLERFEYLGYLYSFDTAPNRLASIVIAGILADVGVAYDLDSSLASIPVPGWINKLPVREALHLALIAIGAYATCSRSNVIQIRPFELASTLTQYDYSLTSAHKGISSPLILRPLVTGVEVTSHWYVGLNDVVNAFSQSLATGEHRLFWGLDVPAVLDAVTGATDVTDTPLRGTFSDVNVASPGTVSVDIERYKDTQRVHNVSGSFPAGTPSNIIQIDATTITPVNVVTVDNANDIAQRAYDYFSQRYLQKTRLYASLLAPGDSVLVDVQSSRQMKGIVERMETDLTGGYVSDVEIVGVLV